NTNKAISGGTFIGGIHTAACGVSWQIAVHGFAGTFVTKKGLEINPHLPPDWKSMRYPFIYQGRRAQIELTRNRLTISADETNDGDFVFFSQGTSHRVAAGSREVVTFA
ncbi:MAG: glycosyl hydrolase family 65 protein, partial [Spirochaetales bacterium]